MKTRTTITALATAVTLLAAAGFASAQDRPAAPLTAKTVVLVHGAFADGSSWNKVIPLLEKAGLNVVAVQNPLDSLEGDVAVINRAIAAAPGPVVLVGHSWAGAVITDAGVNDKVRSLVYVAAYAPDDGQSVFDAVKGYPDMPGQASFVKDADGYVKVSDEGVAKFFAPDLPRAEQKLVAATQGALNIKALSQPIPHAAWHKVPSYFVVATHDQIISPQLQRDQVQRLHADSIEVPSSHVAMLAYPKAVADLIIKAAK
ncbi:alpha/beta fold hydrolase [Pseudomonas sp. PS02290]|uniref:alpha/beta fold hydrolase n=1 Tax=Pseudomonas sp. PS02290 TaxID=2991430 RepID=UPI002499BE44|nr:alpha/beta hydrolase [Pseudomonas sp. PS02290]